MQFFDDLGRLVEQRWKDKNYGEDAFPEIAAQSLGEMDAVGQVDPWEITRHLQAGTELPSQRENEFSDLQITLYNGPRFRIEVYFWLDGTTTIHQHGFSGAFQVLSGSSLHSVYNFREEQEINAHFAAGQVLLKEVQVLKKVTSEKYFRARSLSTRCFIWIGLPPPSPSERTGPPRPSPSTII